MSDYLTLDAGCHVYNYILHMILHTWTLLSGCPGWTTPHYLYRLSNRAPLGVGSWYYMSPFVSIGPFLLPWSRRRAVLLPPRPCAASGSPDPLPVARPIVGFVAFPRVDNLREVALVALRRGRGGRPRACTERPKVWRVERV